MRRGTKRGRRIFSAVFEADTVSLVRQQGCTVDQACQALGLGETTLRRWVAQYEGETAGQPFFDKALPPQQQPI